jgi:SagB-type dehydrogenase family enzyme
MRAAAPRDYDEIDPPPPWPLSRLYHENSKLTERRALELREQIDRFADGGEAPLLRPGTGTGTIHPSRPSIALPRAGRRIFGARLDDALRGRRSPRGAFAPARLELAPVGALLDLSFGTTGELPSAGGATRLRAFPSAGALYPIEIYLAALDCAALGGEIHHYDAERHALARLSACPPRAEMERMIFADGLWEHAALAIVFTGVFERTQAKYGERGYRFVLLEAGHAAQNLLLVARSLGLQAAPIGGFCEDALGAALGLDQARESPVYTVLVGG